MSQYPVGNIVECRFAFTSRALTPAEEQAFLAGGGLPWGVGVDQATVKFDYALNDGAVVTLTGGSVVRDAAGEYHAKITLAQAGVYKYRGYGLDGSGNPVAATPAQTFLAVAF